MFDIAAYSCAGSVPEALAYLQEHPDAIVLAGGTDILPALRAGAIRDAHLLCVEGIGEMQGVCTGPDGTITIGAASTFSGLLAGETVREHLPMLAEAIDTVGGPQIRNMATIGGNICNGAPSADTVPVLLCLDAQLELRGPGGYRTVPLEGFHRSPGRVALESGELLTAIRIAPEGYRGVAGCYRKQARRDAMDIATIGLAVTIRREGDIIRECRIACGVAAPTPIRCPRAEAAARGGCPDDALVDRVVGALLEETSPRDSWRASRAFREQLLAHSARHALWDAYRKAGG